MKDFLAVFRQQSAKVLIDPRLAPACTYHQYEEREPCSCANNWIGISWIPVLEFMTLVVFNAHWHIDHLFTGLELLVDLNFTKKGLQLDGYRHIGSYLSYFEASF